MNTILLDQNNICLIDFNDIFKSIEKDFLNDLYDYKLIKNDKIVFNTDCKRIFYHYLIFHLCEAMINGPINYKKIIYVPETLNESFQLCKMIDCSKLNQTFRTFIKKIEKKLPVLIFFQRNGLDFNFLKNKCFWGKGEGVEFLNFLELFCEKYENGLYNRNFSKIKDLTRKYELKFLNQKYFDNLKTKQILYK